MTLAALSDRELLAEHDRLRGALRSCRRLAACETESRQRLQRESLIADVDLMAVIGELLHREQRKLRSAA